MFFIANWKMNKTVTQAQEFCRTNFSALQELQHRGRSSIVLCPSFEALAPIAQIIGRKVALGAQDCSAYERGPYTGQVSAPSLREIGCTYCIIGHSERRILGETNELVARKVEQLIKQAIIPVICIGETREQYEQGKVFDILKTQLAPLISILTKYKNPTVFAYEPVWSIGTGLVPEPAYLQKIYQWLKSETSQIPECQLIYGGSVNESTVQGLISIKEIKGLLIGDASLDFQKLQKIVSLCS